jgi:hypothetical protein
MSNTTPRSKNKYDTHIWVLKVIESCTTMSHLIGARKLRTKFYKIYDDSLMYNLQNGIIDKMTTRIAKTKLYNGNIEDY